MMKQTTAIVTNRGGRPCHAAIVSLEPGLPAAVGAISTEICGQDWPSENDAGKKIRSTRDKIATRVRHASDPGGSIAGCDKRQRRHTIAI